jgi:DNA-binding NarL/FixJ family response regulator
MRILLADDQPKVRFALHVLLGRMSDIVVVGEAIDAEELLNQTISAAPDVVILDWQLPGLMEIGSISALRADCPDLLVIVLSSRPELERAALDAGADDFISKIDPPDRLLASVSRCLKQHNGIRAETGVD